jgi:hypothetical protein
MIVGDKSRFAIEFDPDDVKLADPKLGEWLYGRLRWWCGRESVGRFEDDTTLRDIAIDAQRALEYAGNRRDDVLTKVSARTAVQAITEALFEDHGQSDEQLAADEERYRRFLVRPLVEEFDAWDVFLFEGQQDARLIWRQSDDDGELHETWLAAGEFDAVQQKFLTELRSAARLQ